MKLRMDIERAIEFLLQQAAQQQAWSEAQLARFDAQQAKFRADFEDRQKDYADRQKDYADRQRDYDQRQRESEARHDREMGAIRAELRRGVRLAVEEARRERKRRKEEDARLAASHAELEQSFKRFLDSMKQPRNGHDQT